MWFTLSPLEPLHECCGVSSPGQVIDGVEGLGSQNLNGRGTVEPQLGPTAVVARGQTEDLKNVGHTFRVKANRPSKFNPAHDWNADACPAAWRGVMNASDESVNRASVNHQVKTTREIDDDAGST